MGVRATATGLFPANIPVSPQEERKAVSERTTIADNSLERMAVFYYLPEASAKRCTSNCCISP
jgi:hypothetical protein